MSANGPACGETSTHAPWSWRKASGGIWLGDDRWVADPTNRLGKRVERVFHAYDVNDNAACEPMCGLVASCEEPNEGSLLCSQCIPVVQENPAGRSARVPSDA